MLKKADRLEALGSAIFSEMDELRKKKEIEGVKTINLSIGSPDLPPAQHIRDALKKEVAEGGNYGYTLATEFNELKLAIAKWYKKRFKVELEPFSEILPLIGSQDGLTHLGLTFLNPGDLALVPDPSYPAYTTSVALAGGQRHSIPLLGDNNFLPNYQEIPKEIAHRAKILFLNYPNNPLAAVADLDFFQKTIDFARKYQILISHDLAYSELAYGDYKPPSILQIPGAKEVAIEFHSFSKTFSMAGCRLGFAVGNKKAIKALGEMKSNIDFGIFRPLLKAGIAALNGPDQWIKDHAAIYKTRADILTDGLNSFGWQIKKPKASMFLWAPLPNNFFSSKEFAIRLLEETGVVVVPGIGFGKYGEGYVRIALVGEDVLLKEAVERIGSWLLTTG